MARAVALASLCLTASALKTYQAEHSQPTEDGTPGTCTCLNWQDVFESGLAQCGDGAELISTGRNLPADTQFCNSAPNSTETGFYMNQPHEMCINFEKVNGPKKLMEGSWCYVSASCSELRGGSKLTEKVNWKLCSGKDPQLSQLSPAELFALAQKAGKSHIDMALMSYSWKEVRGLFPKPPSLKEIVEQVAGEMGWMSPNKTALTRKQPEQTITWKGETWEVHPTKAVCVEGCEGSLY
mmetsp:Transcript_62163/g.144625  ORF Transcript_62163/g.144625 Transcript_62163/m.144625 type:complete len:239 (-) Transcript_62163:121-837(-)